MYRVCSAVLLKLGKVGDKVRQVGIGRETCVSCYSGVYQVGSIDWARLDGFSHGHLFDPGM